MKMDRLTSRLTENLGKLSSISCFQKSLQIHYHYPLSLLHQKSSCHVPIKAQCQNFIVSYSSSSSPKVLSKDVSAGNRILKGLGWLFGFYSRKEVLKRSAVFIYCKCIADIDYVNFMQTASLPNTFQSWFLVAHLHLWLCLVRLKREGKEGHLVTYHLVSLFWKDVDERMKALGVNSGTILNKSLKEFNQEFRGLIIAYEEGLLSDDMTLASAFWRNWVSDKTLTNPQVLSLLVEYVRQQVKEMDKSNTEALLATGNINILSLNLNK